MMKKLLLENIWMKIAAVILAVVLWFFVTSRGQSEISMEVPLELRNIPGGLESVKQSIKAVSINIKGQERLIRNIKPSDVRVNLDLSKAKKGKGTYYIGKDNVKVPSTMAVTNLNPSSVMIDLEETVIKTVPVQPVITGRPTRGFFIGSVEINPKEVTIEGARAEVGRIKSLRTEPIDIADLDETYVQDVRFDTAGRNVRTEIQEVGVKVVIKRK
ncbi:MAG: hypothetical protein HY754_08180 [Nitrospirae bacterium]|nr:hypothetical protein [Nitrospirota bacterium]